MGYIHLHFPVSDNIHKNKRVRKKISNHNLHILELLFFGGGGTKQKKADKITVTREGYKNQQS